MNDLKSLLLINIYVWLLCTCADLGYVDCQLKLIVWSLKYGTKKGNCLKQINYKENTFKTYLFTGQEIFWWIVWKCQESKEGTSLFLIK